MRNKKKYHSNGKMSYFRLTVRGVISEERFFHENGKLKERIVYFRDSPYPLVERFDESGMCLNA